jgi:hypothetical protein
MSLKKYGNGNSTSSTRRDLRPQNDPATAAGMRGVHRDIRGNVIGGYTAEGQAIGTKSQAHGAGPRPGAVRGAHRDLRGNLIGGYTPDGQPFGTKVAAQGRGTAILALAFVSRGRGRAESARGRAFEVVRAEPESRGSGEVARDGLATREEVTRWTEASSWGVRRRREHRTTNVEGERQEKCRVISEQ